MPVQAFGAGNHLPEYHRSLLLAHLCLQVAEIPWMPAGYVEHWALQTWFYASAWSILSACSLDTCWTWRSLLWLFYSWEYLKAFQHFYRETREPSKTFAIKTMQKLCVIVRGLNQELKRRFLWGAVNTSQWNVEFNPWLIQWVLFGSQKSLGLEVFFSGFLDDFIR